MRRHFILGVVVATLFAVAPFSALAEPQQATAAAIKTDPSFRPNTPTPAYPRASRKAKEAGTVRAMLCIDKTGHVTRADLATSSGHPNLDNAVLDWIHHVQMNPAMDGATPVDVCDYPFHYDFIVTEHAPPQPTTTQAGNPGEISTTF